MRRQAGWVRAATLTLCVVSAGCGDSGGDDARDADGEAVSSPEDGGSASDAGSGGRASDTPAHDARSADTASDASTGSNAPATQGGAGAQETFFRFDTFVLKAPSLVLRVLGVETAVTSDVQSMLDTSLKDDAEPKDGDVDLNMLLNFSGAADPAKTAGSVTSGGALCPYPLDLTKPCRTDSSAPFFEQAMSYENASKCELDGTSSSISGACFKTSKGRMTVSLPLFGPVLLDDAQMIGAWAGSDGISQGFIRGFVSEQTATNTKIRGAVPAHLALLDIQTGSALTTFLSQTMRENGANGAGWSFLAQFTAKHARFEAGK